MNDEARETNKNSEIGSSEIKSPEIIASLLPQPVAAAKASLSWLHWLVRVLISSCDRFYWDNGFSKAASLAYTTLLSLVPLMALLFGLLGSFAASSEHIGEIRAFIFKQFVPSLDAADTILHYLTTFSEQISNLNALVFATVVITSILLINSIEYTLNEIWQVNEARSIANRIAIFSAILVISPVLAVSAYYFTRFRVQPYLDDFGPGGTAIASWLSTLDGLYFAAVPYFIDFLAFAALYMLVPKAVVRLRSALFGAFLAAILFGLAKWGFAVYIEHFASYAKIYSTLAAIPIFLFWLYLAWSIVLLGAEASYQAQYLPRTGEAVWHRSLLSVGDGALLLAVQALVMVTRAFLKGQRLPSDLEVAEGLGCSTVVLNPALSALERARIVVRGDSADQPLTLLRSPDAITVADIHRALCAGRSSCRERLHYPAELRATFAYFERPLGANDVTLAQIVSQGVEPIGVTDAAR